MDQETSGGRTPLVRGRRSVVCCDMAALLALSFVRRRKVYKVPSSCQSDVEPFPEGTWARQKCHLHVQVGFENGNGSSQTW